MARLTIILRITEFRDFRRVVTVLEDVSSGRPATKQDDHLPDFDAAMSRANERARMMSNFSPETVLTWDVNFPSGGELAWIRNRIGEKRVRKIVASARMRV